MTKSSNTLEKDRILYIMVLSLISLTTISGLVLSSPTPSAHADDSVVTTTAVTVSESCSMTATVGTPHSASLPNGTYSGTSYPNGVGTTTLRAFCNDRQGFAIYAIGYTGDEYGNTKLHSNTLGNDYDINTGIYTSSSTTNSTWSMKLSSVSGTYAPTISDGTNSTENFTTWHVIPDEYTKVAYRTTGTDMLVNNTGTGSSVEVTYDAYISSTQPAGTYVGQVKYTLVHPSTAGKPLTPLKASDCPAGYVCYAPNASDIVGSMDSISSSKITSSPTAGKISVGTSATTINLIAPNYKREGYGFAGWSTSFDASTATNPVIYGPNETISTNSQDARGLDVSGGAVLYPVWIAKETGVTMQTFNSTNYSAYTSAPNGTIIALEDERDHDVYAVAKLADGQWWMIENLRLDNTATLTTTNTHNPLHDTNNIVTLKTDYANGTIENHLATSNSGTWCTEYSAACYDQTMLNTNKTRLSDSSLTPSYSASNAASKWYGYGNYYNWYSATAGNGTYSFSTNNNSVAGDLCPANWHLPKGGDRNNTTNSEFWILSLVIVGAEPANTSTEPSYAGSTEGGYASKIFRAYPNNFVYSGYLYGSGSSYPGLRGSYWSSSARSNGFVFSFDISSDAVSPGTIQTAKMRGESVRCVAGS